MGIPHDSGRGGSRGRVEFAVTGAQNGAVTYLTPDLTPHSMLLIEDFTSSMLLPFGRDFVFTGRARDVNLVAEMDGIFHRLVGSAVTWSSWNTPAASKPYWNALGGLHGAAGRRFRVRDGRPPIPRYNSERRGRFSRKHRNSVARFPPSAGTGAGGFGLYWRRGMRRSRRAQ